MIQKGAVTNPKTNAVNKTDKEACQWVFLSAVKRFQDQAVAKGVTKVGNLVSYYKKKNIVVPLNMSAMQVEVLLV